MARRSKLTRKVIDDFCDALSIGATYKIACGHAGISYPTFANWCRIAREEMERAERNEETNKSNIKYVSFLNEVEAAVNEAKISWLDVIARAARTDPNWAKWMLEIHDESYKPKTKTEISGPDERGIVFTVIERAETKDDTRKAD